MPHFPLIPTPKAIQQAYEEGFEGWIWNTHVKHQWGNFCSELPTAATVLSQIKDSHKEHKRVLLYKSRTKYDPKAFEEEAQTTGDCVSMGDRNARDITRSVEIHIKGEPESYFKRGATEPTYGARGHGGQGMSPYAAAKFVRDVGFLVRQNYEGVVNLSKYNSSIGTGWGRRGVPEAVKELCRQNNVGEYIVPETLENTLDCLANGYACHSGQNWGTSGKTGKDGINRRSTGWNHDMATGGYDLTREFFKEEIVFVHNSWGAWNQPNPVWLANQDVYGPWIPGTIIVPLDEYERYFVRSGSIYHYSNIKGFPAQTLPNWHEGDIL